MSTTDSSSLIAGCRALLITTGSRGDVQPFLVLAHALAEAGLVPLSRRRGASTTWLRASVRNSSAWTTASSISRTSSWERGRFVPCARWAAYAR